MENAIGGRDDHKAYDDDEQNVDTETDGHGTQKSGLG